jgi:hypothetical protein
MNRTFKEFLQENNMTYQEYQSLDESQQKVLINEFLGF